MRHALREPLLHFAVLGALLFGVYEWRGAGAGSRDEIVVTPGQIENLATTFERTWLRPPSDAELDALVEGWVREDVLYREGLALGLDRDDPVIRNRVRLKLDFVATEAPEEEPGEAELSDWLAAHAADYAIAPRCSFEQLFFDPTRRGTALPAELDRALAALRRAGSAPAPSELGDATLLPAALSAVSPDQVAERFGTEFSGALEALPVGSWQGPVGSGYGVHLVRVLERRPGRIPELAEVRDAVARDLSAARAREASDRLYRRLRERYTVTIEPPSEAAGPSTHARQ